MLDFPHGGAVYLQRLLSIHLRFLFKVGQGFLEEALPGLGLGCVLVSVRVLRSLRYTPDSSLLSCFPHAQVDAVKAVSYQGRGRLVFSEQRRDVSGACRAGGS